ncbi:MAG: oligosaccharide flippase family protein [Hyphomicrobiales bacterium]|nr:oligosaccharide flippase family protein [Hyphomicrobiales bacterium]
MIGSAVANFISLLMAMALARILHKDQYGSLIRLQTIIGLASAFGCYGIGFVCRYAAIYKTKDPRRLSVLIGVTDRIVILVSALSIAGVYAFTYFSKNADSAFAINVIIISAAIIFVALDGLQRNLIIGFSEMRLFALLSIASAVINITALTTAAFFFSLRGVAIALVACAIINYAISKVFISRIYAVYEIRPTALGYQDEIRELIYFTIPGLISSVLPWLAQTIVQGRITSVEGVGQVALFGIAMQWFNIANFIPSTASRALMPSLAEMISNNETRNARRSIFFSIGVSFATAVAVAGVGSAFALYIARFYGNQYTDAKSAIATALMAAIFYAMQYPVQQLMAAKAQVWLAISFMALQSAIFVGYAYWFSANLATVAINGLLISYLATAFASAIYLAATSKGRI